MHDDAIVFFDGECGLCHGTVQWLLRRDRQGALRFAPLQGATAARLLPKSDCADLASLVFFENGRLSRQSSAVVRILRRLGGWNALLGTLLGLVPPIVRNFGYNIIARNRLRWFGAAPACRLPQPGERERFLA